MRLLALILTLVYFFLNVAAHAEQVKQLEVSARSMAYDPYSRRIYASVPGKAPAMSNSLVIIDPANARIEKSVYMGQEPGQIAISDRGKYVWVVLGDSTIRRFDIETQTPGPLYFLGDNVHPEEIHPVPGNPEALLIVRAAGGRSPRFEGIVILENGVFRPAGGYGNTFAFGAYGNRAYSYVNEISSFDFVVMTLTPKGLEGVSTGGGVISGYGPRIRADNGVVYVDGSQAIDPETRTTLGNFPVHSGAYVTDSSVGRMYCALAEGDRVRIVASNLNTFAQIGETVLQDCKGGPSELVRWGEDGLALSTSGGRIVLVHTSLVPPRIASVDLALQRYTPAMPLKAGQPARYTLMVSNVGSVPATGVFLTDRLPREIDVLDLAASQGDITAVDGVVRVKIGVLPPQKSAQVRITIQPRKELTDLVGASAIVRACERDKNPLNNAAMVTPRPVVRVTEPAISTLAPDVPTPPKKVTGVDLTGEWKDTGEAISGSGVDIQATVSGTFIVRNIGTRASPKCKIRFYLTYSTGTGLEEDLLGEEPVPALAPGKTAMIPFKARLEKGRNAIGQMHTGIVDAAKVVEDTNRDNNTVRSKPIP